MVSFFSAVWLNLQNWCVKPITPKKKNPCHSTPQTTSRATPPSHIPFTHNQQHPNSHPPRNTPTHLPAQHLPPKSAIQHHQQHPTQHPPRHLPATPAIKHHQQHPPPTYTIKHPQRHPKKPYSLVGDTGDTLGDTLDDNLRSSTNSDVLDNTLRNAFQPHPQSTSTNNTPPTQSKITSNTLTFHNIPSDHHQRHPSNLHDTSHPIPRSSTTIDTPNNCPSNILRDTFQPSSHIRDQTPPETSQTTPSATPCPTPPCHIHDQAPPMTP